MLSLALRAGLLRDHVDMDSLLDGREYHVRFKEQVLELPVFIGGTLETVDTWPDQPMSADSSRETIQSQCATYGISTYCTGG